MRPTVVVHPTHAPGLIEQLRLVPDIELRTPADADGVYKELLAGADVLVTFLWEDRFLTDRLRLIQSTSAGTDQFPADDLAAAGVTLASARGAHSPAVGAHAIGLLLALLRGLGHTSHHARRKAWSPVPAFEPAGLTVGILGLGGIGEEAARLAVGLGMCVIGTKRNTSDYDGVAQQIWGADGTLAVCAAADALIIALPGAPETRGLVGAAELKALGPGWLVNVGRGSVVDEIALIDAMVDGQLRGAGLDVFTEEPLPPESVLWELPGVIVTPHMGWSTDRLAPRLREVLQRHLVAYRSGRPARLDS